MSALIGESISRLDAVAKVTGAARYSADIKIADTLHAAIVSSNRSSGNIRRIETEAAQAMSGVLGIMTHENAPRLQPAEYLALLHDLKIRHAGQPVAIVVGDSAEGVRRAASLVRVIYEDVPVVADFDGAIDTAFEPAKVLGEPAASVRGDPETALRDTQLTRVDATYTTPMHIHNPMEPHTVTASWDGNRVVVHTSTSGIFTARSVIARAFAIPPENVRVLLQYQGGTFGCKGRAWWSCMLLAISAAKLYARPVRLVLTREQMFVAVGNRQRTRQDVTLAADRDGHLVAMRHEAISETGFIADYSETTCFATRIIYNCPNVAVRHRLVRTNTPQPVPMRGPGEGPGSFALESALDELAEKAKLDPVELRLRNWADHDQHSKRPWSSNSLRECLREGARAFGWERRPVGSMRDGGTLVGWGMASSYYPAFRAPAAARIRLGRDGTLLLECGNQEIGTGAATIMAQAAAAELKTPVRAIKVRYGDTLLPETPMAAGSMSTASVIPAVEAAARALKDKIIAMAVGTEGSGLYGKRAEEIVWSSPSRLTTSNGEEESIAALLVRNEISSIEGEGRSPKASSTHTANTFGACFVEVRVDPEVGQVRISRLVAAYAAGRIMNAKFARSQFVGGLIFGIGMALHEKVEIDNRTGLITNRGLTEYLLPVHADVPNIEVHLIEEEDNVLPSGVKGIGMNGTVGTAAAIANAVYNATGRRIRDLPIFPETLMT